MKKIIALMIIAVITTASVQVFAADSYNSEYYGCPNGYCYQDGQGCYGDDGQGGCYGGRHRRGGCWRD
ncbi:hypothetical protein D081_1453 [Anaerovibrio sp. JC8]|uniref:hypothetical protein n=1 Tax=Anaerovibrio sp. JC8 TaxID=1240085 RepID=UPI000A0E3165|nr:hypothetical protein [Anaerovibrio sp. JC8]ORT99872.1 hypothetical protein D081_1453 [Anaerovibrio sp. JC8]